MIRGNILNCQYLLIFLLFFPFKFLLFIRKRGADAPVRRCEGLVVEGTQRGRGRPKKYWGEVIRQGLAQLHLTEDMTLDRKEWRSRIKVVVLVCDTYSLLLFTEPHFPQYFTDVIISLGLSETASLPPRGSGKWDFTGYVVVVVVVVMVESSESEGSCGGVEE
ncbi:hypothetical protein H5410_054895 [Solanum commersonii]|uniref:Uncharacterized protein n=1 Tax=Solanum commersonii TaxID=4109 RepID=A0A9J5WG53_SOLCO|nr:hypothetical protein H5410_054895 [Solanum commersonii]